MNIIDIQPGQVVRRKHIFWKVLEVDQNYQIIRIIRSSRDGSVHGLVRKLDGWWVDQEEYKHMEAVGVSLIEEKPTKPKSPKPRSIPSTINNLVSQSQKSQVQSVRLQNSNARDHKIRNISQAARALVQTLQEDIKKIS